MPFVFRLFVSFAAARGMPTVLLPSLLSAHSFAYEYTTRGSPDFTFHRPNDVAFLLDPLASLFRRAEPLANGFRAVDDSLPTK